MADINDLALSLFGRTRAETSVTSVTGVTRTTTATATSDSDGGAVTVVMGGETSQDESDADATVEVEVPTTVEVAEGDEVSVTVVDSKPTVTGVVGGGDRTKVRIRQLSDSLDTIIGNTMVREYEGGVLACRTGQAIGALVSADGSFKVVGLTWDGDAPTVQQGSFTSIGRQEVSLCTDTDDGGRQFAVGITSAGNGDISVFGNREAVLGASGFHIEVGTNLYGGAAVMKGDLGGVLLGAYELFSGTYSATHAKAITLSEDPKPYDHVVFAYQSNDGYQGSVTWYPDLGDTFNCVAVTGSGGSQYVKAKTYRVSGTTVDTYKGWSTENGVAKDCIGIVRAVGYF